MFGKKKSRAEPLKVMVTGAAGETEDETHVHRAEKSIQRWNPPRRNDVKTKRWIQKRSTDAC